MTAGKGEPADPHTEHEKARLEWALFKAECRRNDFDAAEARNILADAYVKQSAALSRAEALLAEAREAALKVRSPTETPQTPDGQDRFYIVIVKRGHNGKAYTFPAVHLHNYPLLYIDEDEPIPTTGWYSYGSSEDGEAVNYEKLIGHKGDELLGWAEIPDLAAALLAKLEQG